MLSLLALCAVTFAPSGMAPMPRACVDVRRVVVDMRAVPYVKSTEKQVEAAASSLRRAAAKFGPAQREAADEWLAKTMAGGGFSSAALLQQKVLLFEQCTINDDGSSNCLALDEALVDLQGAMAGLGEVGADSTASAKRLAQGKVNKAALAVRAAATKFGVSEKKVANEWLERALEGRSSPTSLMESTLELFGDCMLPEKGAKMPNKCEELSKALETLRTALGDVNDSLPGPGGKVVPTGLSDMEYRKWVSGEMAARGK